MDDIPDPEGTMQQKGGDKPGLVPFQRFFAVFGYAAFWLAVILGALEGGSWLAWVLYHHLRSPSGNISLKPADPALQEILAHARGHRGSRLSSRSAEVWIDRMGGAREYQAWVNEMSASTAYDKSNWAEDFWTLERQRLAHWSYPYEPFRVWGMMKWQGKYVNDVQTEMGVLRRTVNAMNPACMQHPPTRVWIFGGSTVWGVGAPDSETLPSQLARQINAAGNACVEVTNFGVEAYVSSQELIFLIQELKAGYRPDVVIFYDGLNDACVGGVGHFPRGHNYFFSIKTAFETGGSIVPALREKSNFIRLVRALRRRLARSPTTGSSEPSLPADARATLDNYQANIAIVRMLGEKYGFKTLFFWQPTLFYGKKPTDRFEKVLLDNELRLWREGDMTIPAIRAVYEEAERRSKSAEGFIFLGHLFDDVREPTYIDWMHVGPLGNQLIAEEIAKRIQLKKPSSAPLKTQR
jgi:lysophospholipase L1-like esterase